ncbi:MAG: AMP-binding protein, partial [bacterium]|nr:AMP-binding protein [bacterium]
FELFLPLVCGGRVILARNALELPELPAASAVTLINTVPSALRELLRLGPLPPAVRTVNLAGEPLPRALVDAAYRQPGVERVFNLYGPSEDTTYSTFARIARVSTAAPPIGRPLDGTAAYVLDRGLRPSSLGVPGELYLAGAGLARCYLERPALSAERWLPDPFADRPGQRMYRTGDLVRTLPDGELAFLGRLDHQVKLRGFRIELGEVEVVLGRHPGVRECAVVVRGEQLVAYAVREDGELDDRALREFVGASLPAYMVPAVLVFLERLPLTPSGKVDRRALPAAEGPRRGAEAFVPPRTGLERLLAGIWSEVLGTERVGLGDNFFALGGHSLLATRVVARLNEALGCELPVPLVFDAPELGALAERIGEFLRRREGGEDTLRFLEIPPRDRDEELPLSFSQERLWVLDRLEPGSTAYNLPFAVRLRGTRRVPVLEAALDELVRRHESLRTTFGDRDGEPVQVVAPPARFALPQ